MKKENKEITTTSSETLVLRSQALNNQHIQQESKYELYATKSSSVLHD